MTRIGVFSNLRSGGGGVNIRFGHKRVWMGVVIIIIIITIIIIIYYYYYYYIYCTIVNSSICSSIGLKGDFEESLSFIALIKYRHFLQIPEIIINNMSL